MQQYVLRTMESITNLCMQIGLQRFRDQRGVGARVRACIAQAIPALGAQDARRRHGRSVRVHFWKDSD
jgi:hypothetical protein